MNDLQKIANKRKNNADLRVFGDTATLAWLSEVFHCDGTQAAALLFDIVKEGGEKSAKSEFDANRVQGD